MDDILHLIGKGENDPAFVEYRRQLEEVGPVDPTDDNAYDNAYLDYPQSGICFHLKKGVGVSTIFLYSEGHEEHRSFQGKIPNGLEFGQSRDHVRSRFPVLLKQGGGQIGMLGKRVPIWDLFLWKLNHVHVQYDDDLAAARMITLSAPEEKRLRTNLLATSHW